MSKKWIVVIVASIIILLIGLNIWKSQMVKPVVVETAKLKHETMQETIKVPGTLVLAEEQIVLYELDKGEIAEIFVKENESVKKGEPLLRYENELLELEKKQNEMQIRSLALEIESLRKERRKLDDELKKDEGNELLKQEREQIFLQEQLRNIDLEQAYLEKERLDKQTERLTVTAEVDGVVLQLNDAKDPRVRMGEEPLVHVASLDEMKVKGSVTEYEVLKIEKDQPVRLTADTVQDEQWNGKVESVANRPDRTSEFGLNDAAEAVKYTIYVKPEEKLPLKPGFNVLIEIVTNEADVLTLPANAIQQEDEATFVYVVEAGKVKRKDVKIGMVDAEKMEITDGLTDEDEVIVNPPEDIAVGMEVMVE